MSRPSKNTERALCIKDAARRKKEKEARDLEEERALEKFNNRLSDPFDDMGWEGELDV